MNCSICDLEFEEAQAIKACSSCAVFGGCQKVRCPRCGYESPRETPLVRWVRGWVRRRRGAEAALCATAHGPIKKSVAANDRAKAPTRGAPAGGAPGGQACPLSEGDIGASGTVTQIGTRDRRQVQKLMAMGILPGVQVRLIRRFPSYVFQVDYSQFTVDRELAEKILVQWA